MQNFKILFIVILFLFPLRTFSQKKKNEKNGIAAGISISWLTNSNFDNYYKNNITAGYHMMAFHGFNILNSSRVFYLELDIKSNSSLYRFNNLYSGLVNQSKMGLNFTGNLLKVDSSKPIELLLGPGVYTLWQERIPDPISGLSSIDDGFGAYWGINLNFGLSYSIPIGNKYVGMSYRLFWYPKLTFFNKKDVPEFYSTGSSITIQYYLDK